MLGAAFPCIDDGRATRVHVGGILDAECVAAIATAARRVPGEGDCLAREYLTISGTIEGGTGTGRRALT